MSAYKYIRILWNLSIIKVLNAIISHVQRARTARNDVRLPNSYSIIFHIWQNWLFLLIDNNVDWSAFYNFTLIQYKFFFYYTSTVILLKIDFKIEAKQVVLKSHYDLFVPQLNRCDTLPVISLSFRIYSIVLCTVSVYIHVLSSIYRPEPWTTFFKILAYLNMCQSQFLGFFSVKLGAKKKQPIFPVHHNFLKNCICISYTLHKYRHKSKIIVFYGYHRTNSH